MTGHSDTGKRLRMSRTFVRRLIIFALITLSATATSAQECRPHVQTGLSTQPPSEAEGATKIISHDFDHFPTGSVPTDFIPTLSGQGKAVAWEIRPEPTAHSSPNVLAQTSMEPESFRFPLLVYNKLIAKNVDVSVYFKPVSGQVTQAAGIIARYQDEQHFYTVQANALENEVMLYKVVDNARHAITKANAEVTRGKWHLLQLRVHNSHFLICFDGTPLFETDDDTYQGAGRIGLATKSDGVTIFDDLQILPLGDE